MGTRESRAGRKDFRKRRPGVAVEGMDWYGPWWIETEMTVVTVGERVLGWCVDWEARW